MPSSVKGLCSIAESPHRSQQITTHEILGGLDVTTRAALSTKCPRDVLREREANLDVNQELDDPRWGRSIIWNLSSSKWELFEFTSIQQNFISPMKIFFQFMCCETRVICSASLTEQVQMAFHTTTHQSSLRFCQEARREVMAPLGGVASLGRP